MAIFLGAGIAFGATACTVPEPNTPLPDPNGGLQERPADQDSDGEAGDAQPYVREERDLSGRIMPSDQLNIESIPSARGNASALSDGFTLKGERFALVLRLTANGTYSLSVSDSDGTVCSTQSRPARLYIRNTGLLSDGYSQISLEEYGLKALATLQTENGSLFSVEDYYYLPSESAGDAFNVRRSVTVLKAASADVGFESIFVMNAPSGGVGDYSWFVPNNIFGGFPTSGSVYVSSKIYRETLLGLPFAMFRSEDSGLTFSLARYQPAVTGTGNSYASVSLLNETGELPAIEIAYPARDSARKYFTTEEGKRIVYDLTLRAEATDSYAAATSSVYNAHFELQNQRIVNTDVDEVYKVINEDFKTFLLSNTKNGITSYGLPWRVTIETGKIGPMSYQAGFVGQQIPSAYNMLYYGVMNNDAESFRNGMNVIDFWIGAGMMTNSGIPKIWYYGDSNVFARYPTFLRMAVDAMEGLLDAYRLLSAHGVERTQWYNAVISFADFLVREQNSDGSWYRCYNWDGGMFVNGDNGIPEPGGNICQSSSKTNTTMPVRFLGKIYELTGEERYKTSAIKGGEYVYRELYPVGYYTGGTCDNPNAVDKEAGVYAMYCYDAMYMLTGEAKWIGCLKQATAFTMSTVIAYSFDINANASGLKAALALKHGYTDGLSFITCGGSAVDNYVAYIYYELFRIYVITGETEYLRQADFIQQNTKSTMDWDGALGYPYKSLVPEATTIYSFGFASASDDENIMGVWLPWASAANAEPIAKMYDAFGKADVMEYCDTPIETLRKQLYAFGVGGNAHRKYVTTVTKSYR